MVIGRSADCDVCVHDILLSRHHCRLEREEDDWIILDLASKNGTFLGDHEIGRHVLADGETIRVGKTCVAFYRGTFEQAHRGGAAVDRPNKSRPRPADPYAAMNDTVSGYDYVKSFAERQKVRIGARRQIADNAPVMIDTSGLPSPQPSPCDPKSYQADDVYSLLTDLVSSSWDSIYMNASRPAPTRQAPRPMVMNARQPLHAANTTVDLSLQAMPMLLVPAGQRSFIRAKRPRLRRAMHGLAQGFKTIGQGLVLVGIGHLLTRF